MIFIWGDISSIEWRSSRVYWKAETKYWSFAHFTIPKSRGENDFGIQRHAWTQIEFKKNFVHLTFKFIKLFGW